VTKIGGVLLAAGRGERLRPLTDTIAKPAVDVQDAPLGAYGLRLLRDASDRIAVNLSWFWEATQEALRPYAPGDTRWLIEEPEPWGTARTITALLPELADTFVVANADTITDLRAADLLTTHRRTEAPATLAVQAVPDHADFTTDRGRVTRLIERRREPNVEGVRYIGVAAFERTAIATFLELARRPGLAEALFAPLVEKHDLAIHLHDGYALDVGTPERLEAARRADLSALHVRP
jgi:NDP-sugar pyrophosphorylase family protein